MPTDPELASRLVDMIAFLQKGYTLADAIERAGVSPADADDYLASLRRSLSKGAKKRSRKRTESVTGVRAFADGASRGNPGRAACAAIIYDAGQRELLRRYRMLGQATNNAAEYEAVLLALELCRQLGAQEVRLHLDSELVVRQIEGRYKVKHPDLKHYHARVMATSRHFESFAAVHVPRKDNAEADKLVNAALDGKAEPGEDATGHAG
jgi:ribonuclease HI